VTKSARSRTALAWLLFAASFACLAAGLLVVPGAGSLAVAGVTLAAAAAFQPLRRRVQDRVDRRFNRRCYDAARTVEAFSARLRDQLDLDTLSAELVDTVDRAVQPTLAAVWLWPGA
jgi:hypothetical protein